MMICWSPSVALFVVFCTVVGYGVVVTGMRGIEGSVGAGQEWTASGSLRKAIGNGCGSSTSTTMSELGLRVPVTSNNDVSKPFSINLALFDYRGGVFEDNLIRTYQRQA